MMPQRMLFMRRHDTPPGAGRQRALLGTDHVLGCRALLETRAQNPILRITNRGNNRITNITSAHILGVYKSGFLRSIAASTSRATCSGSPAKGGGLSPAVMAV